MNLEIKEEMGIKFNIGILLCCLFTALGFLSCSANQESKLRMMRAMRLVTMYGAREDQVGREIFEPNDLCKNGTMQSPIGLWYLKAQIAPSLGRLQTNYEPSAATLENRGHAVELAWDAGGGTLLINGTEYVLRQCHWHSPSEHIINGMRSPLEIHMVHESAEGKFAVIDSPQILSWKCIRDTSRMPGAKRDVGIVDPNQININGGGYYRYMGSFTTPPCNEGVIWTVNTKVATVSTEQVRLLRKAIYYKSNARPLQPLNNRTVQLFSTYQKKTQVHGTVT